MTTAMAAVPIDPESIAEAKAHLRIDGDGEDAAIGRLIAAATGLCEGFTGTMMLAREVREIVPAGGDWRRLSLTPVRAITSVEGLPATGSAFALPADGYAIDIDASGDGWVRVTRPGSAARAIVTYEAGRVGGWGELHEPLRQGIVRLVAHLYAHRDAADDAGPPAAVAALWRPWRRMRMR